MAASILEGIWIKLCHEMDILEGTIMNNLSESILLQIYWFSFKILGLETGANKTSLYIFEKFKSMLSCLDDERTWVAWN